MHAPQHRADRLATIPNFREAIRIKSAPLTERLGNVKRRVEALQALCVDARRKPSWLHELQTDTPKRLPIDQIEYEAIQDGIAAGYITERHLAEYFAEKFLIHAATIAERTHATELTFCATVREAAEALEEIAVERGLPSPESKRTAARESVEGGLAMLAYGTELQRSAS